MSGNVEIVDLPDSWKKKFKSKNLKKLVAEQTMWFGRPFPTSREGRRILEMNAPLFEYCETLDDFDYAFEPVMGNLFELIPENVRRQGAGVSVDTMRNALEVDIYFFPYNYSLDENRHLPLTYVRIPIVTVGDASLIDSFVKKYYPGDDHSAMIPFSLDRVAELDDFFIDEYEKTEKICHKVVKGGSEQEIKNCEFFLEFIKMVGLE